MKRVLFSWGNLGKQGLKIMAVFRVDSSDDEEDDTTAEGKLVTSISDAVAPGGFAIVEVCLRRLRQMRSKVSWLGGFDTKLEAGWLMGKVQRRGVPPRDLIRTPSANFVVAWYNKKETAGKLNGQEACELSERLYGAGN